MPTSNRRRFKSPNRRKLNKWRTRISRMLSRAPARGFLWFLSQIIATGPLFEAARRVGVEFLPATVRQHSPTALEMEAIHKFIMGRHYTPSDWPTRQNLEI